MEIGQKRSIGISILDQNRQMIFVEAFDRIGNLFIKWFFVFFNLFMLWVKTFTKSGENESFSSTAPTKWRAICHIQGNILFNKLLMAFLDFLQVSYDASAVFCNRLLFHIVKLVVVFSNFSFLSLIRRRFSFLLQAFLKNNVKHLRPSSFALAHEICLVDVNSISN